MNTRTTKRATLKVIQPESEDQQQFHRTKQNTTRRKKKFKATKANSKNHQSAKTIRKPQSKNNPKQKIKSTKKTATTRTIKHAWGFVLGRRRGGLPMLDRRRKL